MRSTSVADEASTPSSSRGGVGSRGRRLRAGRDRGGRSEEPGVDGLSYLVGDVTRLPSAHLGAGSARQPRRQQARRGDPEPWYAAMPSRTSLLNISVPPLLAARREFPALPGPDSGDHLARCRIDHGAAVDHHGRDRLVTASHRANESGRAGIPPDVDLPDGKMMPPQDKTQPPAEHTARPPVQGDPGRGTGLLAGWAHQAIQPLAVPPRPRGQASPGVVAAPLIAGAALPSLVPGSHSRTCATRS
jgi:hypothetical protein